MDGQRLKFRDVEGKGRHSCFIIWVASNSQEAGKENIGISNQLPLFERSELLFLGIFLLNYV
jgi:hypothetical protein